MGDNFRPHAVIVTNTHDFYYGHNSFFVNRAIGRCVLTQFWPVGSIILFLKRKCFSTDTYSLVFTLNASTGEFGWVKMNKINTRRVTSL